MSNYRETLPDWWKRDRLLRDMFSDIDTPYSYGGDSLDAPDCSEFVRRHLQAKLLLAPGDYSANGLYQVFNKRRIDFPIPGALIFFGTSIIRHVAVAIDGEKMIEAGGGTSKTIAVWEALRDGAFVRVSNINRRNDLYAICDPFKE